MLISYRRRFIFFHVPKVAGRSIHKSLKRFAFRPELYPWNQLLRKLNIQSTFPYVHQKAFALHTTARELQRELPPQIFHQFFKFAFVRNPWDLHVSLYHYIAQTKEHFMHEAVRAMSGFDEFIEHVCRGPAWSQVGFLADDDGVLLVDFVGRYERLAEDYFAVCHRLGINRSLPHVNASRHRDYRLYYNSKTAALVRDTFREDVERFGYDFSGLTASACATDQAAIDLRRAA